VGGSEVGNLTYCWALVVMVAEVCVGVECDSRGCSLMIGYGEDADVEETARARTAGVSRRRLGPSLTLGCV
jgi:hypothetical protein